MPPLHRVFLRRVMCVALKGPHRPRLTAAPTSWRSRQSSLRSLISPWEVFSTWRGGGWHDSAHCTFARCLGPSCEWPARSGSISWATEESTLFRLTAPIGPAPQHRLGRRRLMVPADGDDLDPGALLQEQKLKRERPARPRDLFLAREAHQVEVAGRAVGRFDPQQGFLRLSCVAGG